MTDQYGNGEHPEAGHEEMTEAEAWHDDQPPVDDFADQPSEEMATVSEESEVPEEEQSFETEEEKKKSMLLPAAAGLGGLLFLGAVLYWQFGTGNSSSPSIPAPPPLTTASNAPVPVAAKTPASNSTNDSEIDNIKPSTPASDVAPTTSLASADSKTVSVASSSNGVATPVALPAPVSAPASSEQPATIPAATLAKAPPAPVVVAPTPAPTPVAAPVPAAAPVTAVASSSAPLLTPPPSANSVAASLPKDASIDARLNSLSTHVEELQKSLTEATQQLSKVSNMLAAGAQPAPPTSSNVDDRLNKIEQQLLQMQHARPVTAASPVVTEETPTEVVADATPEKPVAKPVSHVSHKTSHKVASRKSSAHTVKVAAAPASHWVLRAASPNEAWVSNGNSSSDFRHVQVGDTLAGLGRIRAIRQVGDDWVVDGSQGSLR
ncbi:MAG TPA: hypothetical protein VFR09_03050 [Alphaproteobacteria bacterium]|nr:hypothetical protein [Alphaproteobacteria bacterium]